MDDLIKQVKKGRVPSKRLSGRQGHDSGRPMTALGRFLESLRIKLDLKRTPYGNSFGCTYSHLRNVSFGDRPISEDMITAGVDLIETSDLADPNMHKVTFLNLAYQSVWKVEIPTRDNPKATKAALTVKEKMKGPHNERFIDELLEWLENYDENTKGS